MSSKPPQAVAATISYDEWELSLFDRLLRDYVDAGEVDYRRFRDDPDFDRFLQQTAIVDRDSLHTRQQQLSFYINAYNALVIKGIIDGYSPATLLGRLRFFVLRKYRIAGERLSLLRIERQRIVPLGDPRSHFAINCASASCPLLASKSFTAEELDQQLESATQRFVNDSTRVGDETIRTSRIFKWYRDEFAASDDGLAGFLLRYLEDVDEEQAQGGPDRHFEFARYDWRLNGKPPN